MSAAAGIFAEEAKPPKYRATMLVGAELWEDVGSDVPAILNSAAVGAAPRLKHGMWTFLCLTEYGQTSVGYMVVKVDNSVVIAQTTIAPLVYRIAPA